MIDAEYLFFGECAADCVVDLGRASEVLADRLFNHDARAIAVQAIRAQAVADADKKRRACRQIEHVHLAAMRLEIRREFFPAGIGRRIESGVGDQRKEFIQCRRIDVLHRALHRIAYRCSVVVARVARARYADDAARRRHLAIDIAAIQRRQQLAHRQIAGATEDHEIEGVDRNHLNHIGTFHVVVFSTVYSGEMIIPLSYHYSSIVK